MRRNERLIVGSNFPTKLDNLNIGDGAFDGRTAYADAILDITKKVRLSNKSKKMIRKDEKLEAMYNRLEKQFEISEQKKQRSKSSTAKTNAKKYNRR